MRNYISKRSIRKRCIAFRDQYHKIVLNILRTKRAVPRKKRRNQIKKNIRNTMGFHLKVR